MLDVPLDVGAAIDHHGEEHAKKYAAAGPGRTATAIHNTHPTVKPIALMRWLVRMVTPPNGLVIDPFCGSGTTIVACKIEKFRAIGIEQDERYAAIARAALKVPRLRRLARMADAHLAEKREHDRGMISVSLFRDDSDVD